jgi:soluble lytic murein transglycosylase-like protein
MASKYKVDSDLMRRIIKAESGGNPNAKNRNSTASGCSQFIKSTWESTLRQMGREYISPFDAKLNVEAMAFKISRGGIKAWDASKSKWSK